jgi:hypothetical protein
MAEWICHEYMMLGNGTLEGILERLRMKWDILGSNTFWLQMSLSIHGWTKGLTYVSDLAKNEFSDKKVANPFEGNYKAYYSLVNSGKSN